MALNIPPEPAERRDRSFSDAVAMFQPIVPLAGTPVSARPHMIRDLPVADLPDEDGPQPVPGAPRTPMVIARMPPRPPPTILSDGQLIVPEEPRAEPPALEASYTTSDLFRAVVEPSLVHEPQAALPKVRGRGRWLVLLAIPVLVAAVTGLALYQPAQWQAQFRQEVVQPPFLQATETRADVSIPLDLDSPAIEAPSQLPATAGPEQAAAAAPSAAFVEPAAPQASRVVAPSVVAEASLPAPPVPSAEPAGPPAPAFQWVIVRPRAASSAAQEEAARIAAVLKPITARLESQPVQTAFRLPTIQYFRPADADAAQALAAALPRDGSPWRVLAANGQRGAGPGRLEVWLAGQ